MNALERVSKGQWLINIAFFKKKKWTKRKRLAGDVRKNDSLCGLFDLLLNSSSSLNT